MVVNRPKTRPYQSEANTAIEAHFRAGEDRALVVLPTGTGKTVTFSDLIGRIFESPKKYFGDDFETSPRVLMISHRQEILEQNALKIAKVVGRDKVCLYQAGLFTLTEVPGQEHPERIISSHTIEDYPVVAASIQSLLANPIDYSNFDAVVLDEAHHYVEGNEWFAPLHHLGFFDFQGNILQHPHRKLVGFTATPDRADNKRLKNTFGAQGLVYAKDINWMIERGHLLEPHVYEARMEVEGAATIEEAIKKASAKDKAQRIGEAMREKLHHGDKFYRTMVFVSPRSDREENSEVEVTVQELNRTGIRAAGISSEAVWLVDENQKLQKVTGNGVERARRQVFADMKTGKYDALVNVYIGTEGYDDPGIEAVVLARAIGSRSLCVQMIGRASRPDPAHPERTKAFFVDMGGNFRRHDIRASIETLYESEKKNEGGEKGGSGGNRQSGEESIDSFELDELGNILGANRKSDFSLQLKELLKDDNEVHRVAYELEINSDLMFAYLHSERLPLDWDFVRDLSKTLNDKQESLLDAWANDQVRAMDLREPLIGLKPYNLQLVRLARFGLWRGLGGDLSALAINNDSPLKRFIRVGEIWVRKPGGAYTLSDFYNEVGFLCNASLGSETSDIEALIINVIFEAQGWSKEAKTEGEQLQLLFRQAVARDVRLRGILPTLLSKDLDLEENALPLQMSHSSLNRFLEAPMLAWKDFFKSQLTSSEFFRQYSLLLRTLGVSEEALENVIENYIFEARSWSKEVKTEAEKLQLLLRQAVARDVRLRGKLPGRLSLALNLEPKSLPEQIADSALTQFLEAPMPAWGDFFKSQINPSEFFRQYSLLLRTLGANEEEIETQIEVFIFTARGWSVEVNDAQERLQLSIRRAVARDPRLRGRLPKDVSQTLDFKSGTLPLQGATAPLTRFLEEPLVAWGDFFNNRNTPSGFFKQINILLTALGREEVRMEDYWGE